METRFITDGYDLKAAVEDLRVCKGFGFDLETTGLAPIDSRILLAQIGLAEINYVIDVEKVDLHPILPFLESAQYLKIIQNSKFERRFMLNKYGIDINRVFDTQIAEQVIDPNSFDYSLEALARKYANVQLNKEVRKSFYGKRKVGYTQEQIDYAAMDVEIMWPIMRAQVAKLQELEMVEVAQLEFDLAQVVASMEEAGIPINEAKWRELMKENEQDLEASRLRILEIIYDESEMDEQLGMFQRGGINVSSPDQIKKAFNKIGIDVTSTKEQEIAKINHPAAKELLVYRGLDKISTSYGEGFLDKIHPFTKRIHPDFQQLGTETGRFSCREPNAQQIPAKFRACVQLDGYMIVGADYSQIELRILAELSEDPLFMNAFGQGLDLHRATAQAMLGVPLDKVTDDQRFLAKTLNFGITYGMGITKLMDMLNGEAQKSGRKKYSFPEARGMLERYKSIYRVASIWLLKKGNEAFSSGQSETMYGRKRFFNRPDPNSMSEDDYNKRVGAIKRKGSNTPIQGTNADITKLAMLNVYRVLKESGYDAKIINQVHDEIVVLAHKDCAQEVKELVVTSMIESAQQVLKKVPVKADGFISDIWKK